MLPLVMSRRRVFFSRTVVGWALALAAACSGKTIDQVGKSNPGDCDAPRSAATCTMPIVDAAPIDPCDASDPEGRGHAVIAGCPCAVLPGDYCCDDPSGTGYACNNRAWARFFDGRCGGAAPDAGMSAAVLGKITCGP